MTSQQWVCAIPITDSDMLAVFFTPNDEGGRPSAPRRTGPPTHRPRPDVVVSIARGPVRDCLVDHPSPSTTTTQSVRELDLTARQLPTPPIEDNPVLCERGRCRGPPDAAS